MATPRATSRGPLKLVGGTTVVEATIKGTAAETRRKSLGEIEKPKAVAEHARMSEAWDWLVPKLEEAGLAHTIDKFTLELAVRHYALAVEASDLVFADGVVTDGYDDTIKKHPAEAVFRGESNLFLQYGKTLGLSFGSRVRLPSGETAEEDQPNPYRKAE